MCGRFVITSPPEAMRELFGYWERPNFPPRYNIAPTQPVPVIHKKEDGRHFSLMRWGLIPSWMKEPQQSVLINARAETVLEKPSFRGGIRHRRALMPADGFYEWDPRAKAPYFIRLKSRAPFAMAALWDDWMGPDGSEIASAAIVTVAANETLAPIHHRMPVILPETDWAAWLDVEGVKAEAAARLLQPLPGALMEAYRISTRVNKVKEDDAMLLDPAPAESPQPPKGDAAQLGLF